MRASSSASSSARAYSGAFGEVLPSNRTISSGRSPVLRAISAVDGASYDSYSGSILIDGIMQRARRSRDGLGEDLAATRRRHGRSRGVAGRTSRGGPPPLPLDGTAASVLGPDENDKATQRNGRYRLGSRGRCRRGPRGARGEYLAGAPATFATADALLAGLERFADGLPVFEGVEVLRAEPVGPVWRLETSRSTIVAAAAALPRPRCLQRDAGAGAARSSGGAGGAGGDRRAPAAGLRSGRRADRE